MQDFFEAKDFEPRTEEEGFITLVAQQRAADLANAKLNPILAAGQVVYGRKYLCHAKRTLEMGYNESPDMRHDTDMAFLILRKPFEKPLCVEHKPEREVMGTAGYYCTECGVRMEQVISYKVAEKNPEP